MRWAYWLIGLLAYWLHDFRVKLNNIFHYFLCNFEYYLKICWKIINNKNQPEFSRKIKIMEKKQIIHYVDAFAGSGKTHSAVRHAINRVNSGSMIAIVQPGKELLDQTYIDILTLDPSIKINKIHSGVGCGLVKASIRKHINDAMLGEGQILLITHQAFLAFDWPHPEMWEIILDGVPNIYHEWIKHLNFNYKSITDHIAISSSDQTYSLTTVKIGSESIIQRMADSINDEQDQVYQDLAIKLHNSNMWETSIHVESLNRILAGSNSGSNTLHTYSILRPESLAGFSQVIIMGAMFKKSILYLLWENKVEFVQHIALSQNLMWCNHSNGHLLTIQYMYNHDWSKGFRDSKVDGTTVQQLVKDKVKHLMKGREFIYATNNDDRLGIQDAGYRLNNGVHGLYAYQHINHAAFLSALNHNMDSCGFMASRNINPLALTEAQYFQSIYQFVMRTSLRNTKDRAYKTVIVMDQRSAEFLHGYFPGSTVQQIQDMSVPVGKPMGRPKSLPEFTSAAQRQKYYRERKKLALASMVIETEKS